MSFKLLKHIIANLKKRSVCRTCGSRFIDDSIFVLATNLTPNSASALFFIICQKCFSQAFMFTELRNLSTPRTMEDIYIETKEANGITIDEILDMRNFLKTWRGDLKELFKV